MLDSQESLEEEENDDDQVTEQEVMDMLEEEGNFELMEEKFFISDRMKKFCENKIMWDS